MRRRAVTGLGIALLAAAALVLSGCVTIPTAGGVTTQRITQDQGADTTIPIASPPDKDATPSQIVAGFVRAGAGPQNNYAVARQYLASSFSSKWKPGAGTVVSDSSVLPVPEASSTDTAAAFTVSLDVEGQIDATGVYSAQPGGQVDRDFHLVKEKGQWRIDAAQDGVVVHQRDLGSVVQPYDLYFFDPGYEYLVPDLRWFADQGTGAISQRIVSSLIAGPAGWVAAPVLANAFPTGTALGDTPSLAAGTMTVDLTSPVLDAGTLAQSRMLQQLTWSLRQFAQEVRMTAGGLAVQVTEPASASATQPVPYEAIGSDGKTFGPLSASGVTPLSGGLGDAVQALAPTAAALARDRSAVAVRGTGGVSLVSAGAHPVVDPRSGLLAPSLDPQGWVWSAQADPGSLVVVRGDGRPRALPITVSGQLVSIAVSRDGTRLLAGLATDSGARVIVLGIQRDKDGVPVSLGTPFDVAVDPDAAVIGAAWIDAGSVAVLAGDAGGLDTVTEYALGGLATAHGAVRGGAALAAGSGATFADAVRVLLASGQLEQPSVVGDWQSTGDKLSFLGVQQ